MYQPVIPWGDQVRQTPGALKDKDFGAGHSEERAIEIKRSIDLGFDR